MTDFLLELRSEEIPARMQDKARADLARLFEGELAKAGLKAASIETYATPRRLALIARGLPLETQAVSEETKGPKTSAPPQALEGFLRKTGLRQDQLIDREGTYFAVIEKAGRATADVLGEAIPAIIRAFPWPKSQRWGAASLSTESLRWVRPLQGIIALLGDTLVPCEIDGIVSGRETVGHRFMRTSVHPEPVEGLSSSDGEGKGNASTSSAQTVFIQNTQDYAAKLRAAFVVLDQNERAAIIRAGAAKTAADAGLVLVADEGLVAENAGLTEWPVPMLGRFDAAFLEVPEEVIQLTARVNQKYFVCQDAAGKLANAFVCTANIVAHDGGSAVIAGNEKVLAARLSDAKFFWEADLKVRLEDQAAKLSNIVFHEKLGSVADKVERVAKLARWLVESGVIKPRPFRGGVGVGSVHQIGSGRDVHSPHPNPSPEGEGLSLAQQAQTAARLCKADLVTGMVGEFPELQGIMGGYYARAQGHEGAVADAIRDHYKPVGQGDDVPTAPVTVAVSLADKLDTISQFFYEGMSPTGSKDPYALRRAAIACIAIIETNLLRMNVTGICRSLMTEVAYAEANERFAKIDGEWTQSAEKLGLMVPQPGSIDASDVEDAFYDQEEDLIESKANKACVSLSAFLADRLKVQQREAGVRHDLIDAVFALGGEDDLVRLLARVRALQAFVGTDEGVNLLSGYKRAANILKAGGSAGTVPSGTVPLSDSGETGTVPMRGQSLRQGLDYALESALSLSEPLATAAIAAEDFEAAMSALASLRAPIDAFFDGVMVNDPDPAIREYRLGLLTRFRDAVHKVADFSKIEG